MLVPGIRLIRPGLMPVIALAVTGALIFVLGRRTVSAWVGILAWMIWLGLVPPQTTFRPSYFSEILTEGLWLGAWWALLEWRDGRRGQYLVLLGSMHWLDGDHAASDGGGVRDSRRCRCALAAPGDADRGRTSALLSLQASRFSP